MTLRDLVAKYGNEVRLLQKFLGDDLPNDESIFVSSMLRGGNIPVGVLQAVALAMIDDTLVHGLSELSL